MNWRFALIGQPVAHSRSPGIHQALASQFGQTVDYALLECGEAEVGPTVADFFANGGQGMNVTVPHKAAVIDSCASVSETARRARSVNTLIPQADGSLHGETTDGAGCVRDLKRLGVTLAGARIAVIGAGGAARGLIQPLLETAPAELVWSHRNPLKLEPLQEDFAGLGPLRFAANMALKGDRFDLLINATAAGHKGEVPLLPHALFADGGVAYDLSYGPVAEPFLRWAHGEGAAATHGGLGMLIEQAALSFSHWTGQTPDTAPIHASLAATKG